MHAELPLQGDDDAFDRLQQGEAEGDGEREPQAACTQNGGSYVASTMSSRVTITCPTMSMTI